MGNYLWLQSLDKELKYKSNGNRYIEYRLINKKSVTDVFKIMVKLYPTYKINSIDNDDHEQNDNLDIKTKLINIYFDDVSQNAIMIEVFN